MTRKKQRFDFSARISQIEGLLVNTVIFLPEDVVAQLPEGRCRARGKINNVPFALAPQYMKGGGRYFAVSAGLRKATGAGPGDPVQVVFELVDPDKLDVPEELEAVLAQDEEGMAVWNTFTTGYQRSLIHYITSVKHVDSRIKRALDLVNKAKAGLLQGQKKK